MTCVRIFIAGAWTPNARVTARASRPINSAKAHSAHDACEEISVNQYSLFTLFLFWKIGVPMYMFKRFDSTYDKNELPQVLKS